MIFITHTSEEFPNERKGSLCSLCFQWNTSDWDSLYDIVFCITCRESQRWLTSKLSDKLAVQNKVVMNIPQRKIANTDILIITVSTSQWHPCMSHLTWLDIIRGSSCICKIHHWIWSMWQNWYYEIHYIYSIFFNNLQNYVLSLCFLMRKLT